MDSVPNRAGNHAKKLEGLQSAANGKPKGMRQVGGPVDPRNLKEGEYVSGATFRLHNNSVASHEVSGDHKRYNDLVQHYVHNGNAVNMTTNISKRGR